MGARQPLLKLFLISGYVLLAAIVVIYLIVIASGGAFFTPSEGSFSVEVDRAPGLKPAKTSVVNPAGVNIGVVTSVERTEDAAVVDFKLTSDLAVHSDATGQVITKTILGEKALMIDPGSEAAGLAEDGARFALPSDPLPVEPSDSLDPLGEALGKLPPLDAGDMLRDLRQQLVPVLGQVDSTVADIARITDAVGANDGALGRIGTRTSELLAEVSARDADIASIVSSLAILTAEISEIINTNLAQLSDILVLTSRLTTTIAERDAELSAALEAMPVMVDRLGAILDDTVRAFNREPGHVLKAQLANLPPVGRWLEVLKEER